MRFEHRQQAVMFLDVAGNGVQMPRPAPPGSCAPGLESRPGRRNAWSTSVCPACTVSASYLTGGRVVAGVVLGTFRESPIGC